ncbi:glycosyltransferase family 9 protein [bacterium]
MKKILIIRFSSLGDIVATTSFVESVKKQIPDSKLYFLTKDAYEDVLLNNPNIETIYSIGKKKLGEVIKELRDAKIDVVFDLHNNLRSRIVSLIVGKKIYRYKKDIFSRRLLVLTKKWFGKNKTVIQKYADAYTDSKLDVLNTKIYLTKHEKKDISQKFDLTHAKKYIGINTSAKWQTKKLPTYKYTELVSDLIDNGYNVILFGNNNSIGKNQKILTDIDILKETSVINTTGILSIRELCAMISFCDMLVTVDSAPMHIAQALDVPVVAIFGSTVKEFGFWMPRQNDTIIERKISCRPCTLHGKNICPKKHFKCMNDVDVQDIADAIKGKK